MAVLKTTEFIHKNKQVQTFNEVDVAHIITRNYLKNSQKECVVRY